jgi:hypothetical protein
VIRVMAAFIAQSLKYLAAGVLGLLCFGAVFHLLNLLSKRRNRLTPGQVADAIQRHLEGNEGPRDWDYFTSIPIADENLDKIRLRCIEIADAPSSQVSRKEIREIISHLRSLQESLERR